MKQIMLVCALISHFLKKLNMPESVSSVLRAFSKWLTLIVPFLFYVINNMVKF